MYEPNIAGYEIITVRPQEIKRTLFQRLFTRPWRPFRRISVVPVCVPPKGDVLIDKDNRKIYVRNDDYPTIMKALKR